MASVASIKLEELPESLQPGNMREAFERESIRAVNEMVTIAHNNLVSFSPVVTGALSRGWKQVPAQKTSEGIEGKVTNAETSAVVTEYGAKPHFPPISPPALGVWIQRALGISDPKKIRRKAFAISSAIRNRGLPGPMNADSKGMFGRVIKSLNSEFFSISNSIVENVKTRFNV